MQVLDITLKMGAHLVKIGTTIVKNRAADRSRTALKPLNFPSNRSRTAPKHPGELKIGADINFKCRELNFNSQD